MAFRYHDKTPNSHHEMNRLKQLLTLACALAVATLTLSAADAPQTAAQFAETRNRLLARAQTTALTAKEHFDLAVGYFACGQFTEGETVARLGLGLSQNGVEKGALYTVIAQCNGALGEYPAAAKAALAGQRHDPLSKELAGLRLVYFGKIEDEAQRLAAEDTLRQLETSGEPVWVVQGCMVVVRVARVIITLATLYDIAKEQWPVIQPEVVKLANELKALFPQTTKGSR